MASVIIRKNPENRSGAAGGGLLRHHLFMGETYEREAAVWSARPCQKCCVYMSKYVKLLVKPRMSRMSKYVKRCQSQRRCQGMSKPRHRSDMPGASQGRLRFHVKHIAQTVKARL